MENGLFLCDFKKLTSWWNLKRNACDQIFSFMFVTASVQGAGMYLFGCLWKQLRRQRIKQLSHMQSVSQLKDHCSRHGTREASGGNARETVTILLFCIGNNEGFCLKILRSAVPFVLNLWSWMQFIGLSFLWQGIYSISLEHFLKTYQLHKICRIVKISYVTSTLILSCRSHRWQEIPAWRVSNILSFAVSLPFLTFRVKVPSICRKLNLSTNII